MSWSSWSTSSSSSSMAFRNTQKVITHLNRHRTEQKSSLQNRGGRFRPLSPRATFQHGVSDL